MSIQEKVQQHYVSSFYLRSWRTTRPDGQVGIWAKTGGAAPRFAQGRNALATGERFYRVEVDRQVRGMMDYKYPVRENGVVAEILAELDVLAGIDVYMARQLPHHERLDLIRTNYLEDKYSALEDKFSKTLDRVRKRGRRRLLEGTARDGALYHSLIHLYATQLFRTPTTRDAVLKDVKNVVAETASGTFDFTQSQTETLFKLTIYIESLRLAERLCKDQVILELYRSDGDATFHTSNAPAQKLFVEANEQKEFLGFLGVLPLTPYYFMKITKNGASRGGIVVHPADCSTVARINELFLRKNQGADTYATSEGALMHI